MSKNVIKTPTTILHHTYLADMAGCGYIRCIFPSMLLSQYNHNNRVQFLPSYGMHFINDIEYYKRQFFVMFQRSATPDQLKLIQYFKQKFRDQTKTPLLYEIDDLLTDIPKWNYAHDYYNQHSKVAIEIMKLMDGMIVSTDKLKEIYSQYNSKIEVSKNHLVKGFWGEPEFKFKSNGIERILWAGSGNHFSQNPNSPGGDFGTKLLDFIKKTEFKYKWIFVGGMPPEVKDLRNVENHGWINIFDYPNYIKSLNIDLAIAPLENNIFNECKSNIKALEYTAAGIPGIYSNIEPYKNLTITTNTEEHMIDKIENLISDKWELRRVWKSDYERLKSQLFWEDNNNLSKYYNKLVGFFNLELPK